MAETEQTESPHKSAEELAYDAGKAAMSEPPERRSAAACPFSPLDHPKERREWLRGFADALDEQADLTDLRKELQEARDD